MSAMPELAAVILTGGTASRMGGTDKAALEYAGRSLLERALAAVADAGRTVVVGPPQETSRPVTFVREEPPLGGPAAGLLAGVDALPAASSVVVLAVDMPLVDARTVARLLAAATGHDGAFLVGPDGRRQLAGVLTRAAVERARPERGAEAGLPMHRLLSGLDLAEVSAAGGEARDVDTWDDYSGLPPDA
ncbi:molybdenum cofactor guanylyltransferase [Nocardioides sp.]|uniref:molybdenum cofactor guanylyltransferase n=1 Tax=Nocardioides sp. TaxID=35761 RepID=UPI0035287080